MENKFKIIKRITKQCKNKQNAIFLINIQSEKKKVKKKKLN